MCARNGKIARLPREIRDELNERLECSEESPQLLPWLNALPEVKKIVQNHFASVPISKQNLSEWRQGGFQERLARRDLCEDARDLTQLSEEMQDEFAHGVLADDVALVLAARFGSLIANWNGEVDEKFEARTRVLNRVCRSVVQLQRGMHRANREAFELTRSLEEKEKAEQKALQERLVKPFWDTLKMPAMAKLFGGGTAGRKIAEYILAVRRGKLDSEFDLLPTDKYGDEEPAAKEAKPVKPARNRRTMQPAAKTNPDNAVKPLQKNKMESGKENQSSQDQSGSVRVNQTNLQSDEAFAAPFPNLNPNPSLPTPEDHPEAGQFQQVTDMAGKGVPTLPFPAHPELAV